VSKQYKSANRLFELARRSRLTIPLGAMVGLIGLGITLIISTYRTFGHSKS
jgi:hypothetical protein